MADDTENTEDLFASPSPPTKSKPAQVDRPKTSTNQNARFDIEQAREAALKRELEGVRNINEVIEGVNGTLERARGNMSTVSRTVNNASTLLTTWTRILSQTEHNQRLILDPNWKGSSQDLLDMENETVQRQQAAERRAAEEVRRRQEARRRLEEDDHQRQVGGASSRATRGPRGIRGRGRGVSSRGSSSGYGDGERSALSISSARSASGIGRGYGTSRYGRSRGAR